MGTYKNTELIIKNSAEFPCSYIKGKLERRIYVNLSNQNKNKKIISDFTKRGFRRNHNHMYIPSCINCNACISTRINIKKFSLSKSNKRNLLLGVLSIASVVIVLDCIASMISLNLSNYLRVDYLGNIYLETMIAGIFFPLVFYQVKYLYQFFPYIFSIFLETYN